MSDVFLLGLSYFADASAAITVIREYVAPTIKLLAALAGVACTFFIVNAGYLYMTSRGNPETMTQAKRILKNALIGLVIVLGASTATSILSAAYGGAEPASQSSLPKLETIEPKEPSNGLVDVLIKAVVGFLNTIIQSIATPFLGALDYFTKQTPLMAENPSVFNLWLIMVGIANVLFIVVLALIGLHVMSAASFGFDEIEFKHLLPRIGLVFLLINSSIFIIDGVIELSNAIVAAINTVSGTNSVWKTLTAVVEESGGQGLAALLMMLTFLIFSVVLLVYYVGRLVTLFIGAVLSPLIVLVWLIPGFRDFSETASKTYLSTIFVLLVHVVILLLAASLFTGMSAANSNGPPDVLIAMIVGLATILALLKTQGVMMQFSYVSMGSRNARKLGGQFMNGVSYMTGKGATAAKLTTDRASSKLSQINGTTKRSSRASMQTVSYSPSNLKKPVTVTKIPAGKKTGDTFEAPKPTLRTEAASSAMPKNNAKDKII